MTLSLPIVAFAAIVAQASPGTVRVWKSSELNDRGATLAKKLDAQKVASEVVATEGNRTFMVTHPDRGSPRFTTPRRTSW